LEEKEGKSKREDRKPKREHRLFGIFISQGTAGERPSLTTKEHMKRREYRRFA
jgi:hypothetical protein